MPGELDYLEAFRLMKPSARLWNAMLAELARRELRLDLGPGAGRALPHPWKTVAARQDEGDRSWRVDVRAGWVNDLPAVVPYRREGDPRGWRMPANYPAPKAGEDGHDARWVGRWMNELEEPPFLTIETPPSAGIQNSTGRAIVDAWEEIATEDFPAYFTEFYPEHVLFRATVLVTAAKVSAREFYPEVPAPAVGPHRLACGKRPSVVPVPVGGFLEVAWLWLVREPERRDPAEDEMLVQQLMFYDLATQFVDNATRWWTA
jgi:hypothetical protein